MTSAIQSLGNAAVQQGVVAQASLKVSGPRHVSGIEAIEKTAKDFESMFMAQMLQPMFEGVEVNGMFGGGHGEEAMRGLLVQEYGKAVAQGSSFGLSNAIRDEMIRMQESRQAQALPGGVS